MLNFYRYKLSKIDVSTTMYVTDKCVEIVCWYCMKGRVTSSETSFFDEELRHKIVIIRGEPV